MSAIIAEQTIFDVQPCLQFTSLDLPSLGSPYIFRLGLPLTGQLPNFIQRASRRWFKFVMDLTVQLSLQVLFLQVLEKMNISGVMYFYFDSEILHESLLARNNWIINKN